MAVKKSKKAVQEYDPLSWLKEDASEAPAAAGETVEAKSAEPKKVAGKKKVAKKTAVKKVSGKKIVDKKPEQPAKAESTNDIVEGTNFGFFGDDEPAQTDAPGSDSIVIGSELTIKNVAEFKQQIDDSLSQQDEIRLDAAELQKIDTAGLQLLFSLQKSLQKSGHQIEWTNQSDVIVSAAKIIGMGSLFESDMASIEQDQGFGFF